VPLLLKQAYLCKSYDGKVRDTKVIGGSPLLAQEAVTAVKKWKYEEASKESVENVEVVFQ